MTAAIPRCEVEWDARCILPLHHHGPCEVPDESPCGRVGMFDFVAYSCELFAGHNGPHLRGVSDVVLQWIG